MVVEGKGRKGGENEEKEVNNPHNPNTDTE